MLFFGLELVGNGFIYFVCGLVVELIFFCFIGLVVVIKMIYLCLLKNFEMLIYEK